MTNRAPLPPYYYQIKMDLLSKLSAGLLKEGDRIPSENQLAKDYSVSRPTVRRALDELVNEGVVFRRQGKGTFIASERIHKELSHYSFFFEDIESIGKHADSRVLRSRLIPATSELAKLLRIEIDDQLFEISVLRYANDEPVVLRTAYYPVTSLPESSLPELRSTRVDERALLQMIEKHGLSLAKAERTIQVVSSREHEAKLLEVETGFPLILWEGVTYSQFDDPIELTRALYRSDRFQFHVVQYRNTSHNDSR